ncbi:hypothetical protein NIES4072_44740 [Nostoc commune NIES-4072]|uniref:Uncharacterized protein n=1 Tax=Nostoc commune NIES-4072 TaxID=2005467 RepID=A0A2R5FPV1_NOSCO|nr:hypothetical protein [Nostoc commune]BBD68214.1 hypothetical protein NIES4070_46090 [Nostoc commune HK-02]GBG20792.1 hypothetical protein NIES4072_44740 [Nostoc commune NIES-4072]
MTLENQKNQDSNAVIERALSLGIQKSHKGVEDEFTLKLSESQESKIEEICDFLGCSLGSFLNLAINCAISSAKIKGVSVNELEGYPKELGTLSIQVELTTKTNIKLQDAGMKEKVTECAVLGIEIFHKYFIYNNIKDENE